MRHRWKILLFIFFKFLSRIYVKVWTQWIYNSQFNIWVQWKNGSTQTIKRAHRLRFESYVISIKLFSRRPLLFIYNKLQSNTIEYNTIHLWEENGIDANLYFLNVGITKSLKRNIDKGWKAYSYYLHSWYKIYLDFFRIFSFTYIQLDW